MFVLHRNGAQLQPLSLTRAGKPASATMLVTPYQEPETSVTVWFPVRSWDRRIAGPCGHGVIGATAIDRGNMNGADMLMPGTAGVELSSGSCRSRIPPVVVALRAGRQDRTR